MLCTHSYKATNVHRKELKPYLPATYMYMHIVDSYKYIKTLCMDI